MQNIFSSSLSSKNIKINIYSTIILPVVLYGCETWSFILREKHGLMFFEDKVLRKTAGPTRDGVTVEWRRLHNEELYDLYCSTDIIRVIKSRRKRWAGHVTRMENRRDVHRVSVRKTDGKRPRRRW